MIFPKDSHEVILHSAETQPLPSFSQIKTRYDHPEVSRFLGFLVFIVSFVGLFLTTGPIVEKEIVFRFGQFKKEIVRIVQKKPPVEKKIKFADLLGKVEFEPVPAPVDAGFGIVIPKIGVNSKIVPNVDPNIPKEFTKALKIGVAHAAGSSLPDEQGTVFIFGHSTNYAWNVSRYNAVFYQIKDLEIGDEINLFYNGRRYFYKVTEKRIVGANDTSFLENQQGKLLILQTCWPPGTTKERLLIFAKPVQIEVSYNLGLDKYLIEYYNPQS